jgi:hypothetical protein
MKKSFEIKIPDEPYKDQFDLGKTIKAEYCGSRYLLIAVDSRSQRIEYVAQESDESADFDLEQYHTVPNTDHVIIDAEEYTWEAAYITKQYRHETVPEYTFVHPDGTRWTYSYAEETGILDQTYLLESFFYDVEKKEFRGPSIRLHIVSREDFFLSVDQHLVAVKKSLAGNRPYTDEEKQKLIEFRDYLENLPQKLEGIDHWKATWFSDLPPYF